MTATAVVVAGGAPIPPSVMEVLPARRWVVAADSGADHARAIGLEVDLLVGDMDSVTEDSLGHLEGVPTLVHPVDKDATDLDLALRAVLDAGDIDRVLVLGGIGGRLDHLLANAAVLCSPHLAALRIEWLAPPARTAVVRDGVVLRGRPGELVSLIPLGGAVAGVHTEGLRWALAGDDLAFGASRGVSNEMLGAEASVTVSSGVLLVVQPEALA
jgi:thiamine pyrophosphokinase